MIRVDVTYSTLHVIVLKSTGEGEWGEGAETGLLTILMLFSNPLLLSLIGPFSD